MNDDIFWELGYPVLGKTIDPRSTFSNLPKWKGEYGNLRKELLSIALPHLSKL